MKRISKRTARKLFNEKKDFLIIPCKVNPNNVWGIGAKINQYYYNQFPEIFKKDFDVLVREYTFYNCSYETGYYPAYYIEDYGGDVDGVLFVLAYNYFHCILLLQKIILLKSSIKVVIIKCLGE